MQKTLEMHICLWVGKIPWSRKWQPALIFLPGKSHGQRTMVGHKMLDRTEHTHNFYSNSTVMYLTNPIAFSHEKWFAFMINIKQEEKKKNL